ncbi:MAG: succinylglutamate desuccinylase/aspartoacylase family protein [Litorilinea sp.]
MPTNSRPWEGLARGERWQGHVNTGVADLPPVPVLAARGRLDGPRITVFGAVHGDEYEGTAAIHALFDALEPADLDELGGLLIGVPVANGAAWQARSRTTPHDGQDLNRAFSGSSDAIGSADPADRHATPTSQLAHFLFQTFIAPTDVIIDLHSGGLRLVHLPLIGWGTDPQGTAPDGRAEALARIFGLDFYPWQVGTTAGVLTHEATRAGKIAIGAEWGGGASLDVAGMGAYAHGLRRIWQVLGPNGPWEYESDPRPPLIGGYATAPVSGIFHPTVTLGQTVTAGATLGVVVDDLGAEQATLTSARAGLVAGLAHVGYIAAGDPYVYVGAQEIVE